METQEKKHNGGRREKKGPILLKDSKKRGEIFTQKARVCTGAGGKKRKKRGELRPPKGGIQCIVTQETF